MTREDDLVNQMVAFGFYVYTQDERRKKGLFCRERDYYVVLHVLQGEGLLRSIALLVMDEST
jgi:hypothetical protein